LKGAVIYLIPVLNNGVATIEAVEACATGGSGGMHQ